MPKSCAARQCCNRYSSRRKQLTFHRFPFSRPELLKEWVLNIGRVDFKPKQHTVICSEHFRPECFSAFGNRKNLKHNAVPTVFAFREPTQLARGDADPAGRGEAASQEEVCPKLGAGDNNPAQSMDGTVEELQLLPCAKGLVSQDLLLRPSAAETSPALGTSASCMGPQGALPGQPSDHSYALLDLDALKRRLFLTLRENKKLRRRLQAQRLVLRRVCSHLRLQRARGSGHREPGPGVPS